MQTPRDAVTTDTTIIEFVRHARALSRDRWWGRPDRERPLTDAGRTQASELATHLGAAADIAGLYSSPWTRCTQTLEPLAGLLDLPVSEVEALREAGSLPVHDRGDAWVTSAWLGGRAVAFLDRAAAEHAGRRVVACSHGDVIPATLSLLAGRDALEVTDVRCKKAGRWTLTFSSGRCTAAAYHLPPS